jgi:hypothetical protein
MAFLHESKTFDDGEQVIRWKYWIAYNTESLCIVAGL